MRKNESMTDFAADRNSAVKRFFSKDFSQVIVFAIPMVFLAIFLLYPMFTTLVRAFMAPAEDLAFHGFSLESFKQFFTSNLYKKSLLNSFIVSIAVTLLCILIGVPMGYCVARVKMPGKRLILSLGILPIIMPSFVGFHRSMECSA